jgi:serine phosphatase RsbU (regulator of sigma subunit)
MSATARPARAVLEWGWAGSARDVTSGDLHVVVAFTGGALVGLIDGLGHGPAAAESASTAVAMLEAFASDTVVALVQRCHEALRNMRGAVMSLASYRTRDSSITWIGVGNVDGVLMHSDGRRADAIASRGGVIGFQIPVLRAQTVRVSPGDTLIMTTDGIHSGFTAALAGDPGPQEIAASIRTRFTRGSDDAHVVVARYLGGAP